MNIRHLHSMKNNNHYAVHWFRRDLRVAGNKALEESWKTHSGRVLGVFLFDKKFLAREDFSHNRFQFFLKTLKALKEELQDIGGDLLVLDSGPDQAFDLILNSLKNKEALKLITWNRDYEPFALERDKNVEQKLKKLNIEVKTYRDHLIIEPHELHKLTGKNEGYQVFTPFSKTWRELFFKEEFQQRILSQKNGMKYLEQREEKNIFSLKWKEVLISSDKTQDQLDAYLKKNAQNTTIEIPEAGALEAIDILKKFKKPLQAYDKDRDIPSLRGTSKMSMFLKNGSITTSQIIYFLKLNEFKNLEDSSLRYLTELIWREFYYHILFRHPRVEGEAFILKYKKIKWQNNEKFFKAWTEGKTGYPIVDAGMRELKQTGWMHNRVRMIVASFLTKDLLIDWKWGEQHFMKELLDGDLAPNNGGWQWAASTGCDPQPYFRVFNPWMQSERFDAEGIYIKKFIPELADIPVKDLHKPILNHRLYPSPIVDHKTQKDKALMLYKACDLI